MPNHITNSVSFSGSGAHEFLMTLLNKDGNLDFNRIIKIPDELNIPASNWVEDLAAVLRGNIPQFAFHGEVPATAELALADFKSRMGVGFKSHLKLAKQFNSNIEKYGFGTWYDANRSLWGTKWNAYSQRILLPVENHSERRTGKPRRSGSKYRPIATRYYARVLKKRIKRYRATEIRFDTAWSTPKPIWKMLQVMLPPGVIAKVKFADEDTGSNCGYFTIGNDGFSDYEIAGDYHSMTKEDQARWTKFAFELTHPGADPRSYGYNENWEYDDSVEEEYYEAEEANG